MNNSSLEAASKSNWKLFNTKWNQVEFLLGEEIGEGSVPICIYITLFSDDTNSYLLMWLEVLQDNESNIWGHWNGSEVRAHTKKSFGLYNHRYVYVLCSAMQINITYSCQLSIAYSFGTISIILTREQIKNRLNIRKIITVPVLVFSAQFLTLFHHSQIFGFNLKNIFDQFHWLCKMQSVAWLKNCLIK